MLLFISLKSPDFELNLYDIEKVEMANINELMH